MTCAEARGLLDAHVDAELDPRTDRDVALHLEACAACRARAEKIRAVGVALRAQVPRRTAPPALERRIRHASSSHASRPFPLVPLFALAASVVLVAVAAVLVLARPGPRALVARDVVNGHVRALLSGKTVDVASSDQHTVKPWFPGKMDFSPPVPDLASAGFALEGGRVESVDGHAVAALVYRRRQHVISVFLWPEGREPEPGAAERDGFHVRSFKAGGTTFTLVSDVAPADLEALERAMRAALGAPDR